MDGADLRAAQSRVRESRAPRKRLTAVVLGVLIAILAGGSLSACEYSYDDTRAPLPAATFTDPSLPRDPNRNTPVTGEAIDAWAEEILPNLRGQTFHTAFGLLAPGESRADQTVQLPAGSYAVTLACKSRRQVGFVVQNGDLALIDLMVQCGSARVNVVQLASESVLVVTATASRSANYAFRVSKI